MSLYFTSKSTLHVGIIMDGNGRWALARGLAREAGHRAGVETVARIVEAAPEAGIGVLSLFAFSSDNWRRPRSEVDSLGGNRFWYRVTVAYLHFLQPLLFANLLAAPPRLLGGCRAARLLTAIDDS